MAKRGRRPALDETKKQLIAAILAVGCSRRTAAAYVGCAVSTIQNTANRDSEFAEQLRQAESHSEIAYLKKIKRATEKEQYWRAAAWVLERRNPRDFARRGPNVLTTDDVKLLMVQLAELVVQEVPVARYRKSILRRLDSLIASLPQLAGNEVADEKN